MKEEKIMILQMLQDGKITPEDAIELLEALGEPDDAKDTEVFNDETNSKADSKFKLSNKTLEEIGSDIGNAFSNLFTSLKGIGSSIGLGNLSETLEVNLEENIANLTEPTIDIKSVNGHIKVKKHNLDNIKIDVQCRYKEGADILNRELYKFYLNGDKVIFYPLNNNDISLDLDVKLPSRLYGEINLESTNGPIEIDGIDVDRLICDTKNSSIIFSHIKSKDIRLSSRNGRIEGSNIDSETLEAITTNSGIYLKSIDSENLNTHTANGKIRLREISSNNLVAKTSNSSIDAENLSSQLIDLKTSNAKIICNSFDANQVKEVRLSTSNGSINSNINDLNKDIHFDLETSMGNISLDYPNLVYVTNKQANFGLKKILAHTPDYDINKDYIKYSAYTSNGSIKIN